MPPLPQQAHQAKAKRTTPRATQGACQNVRACLPRSVPRQIFVCTIFTSTANALGFNDLPKYGEYFEMSHTISEPETCPECGTPVPDLCDCCGEPMPEGWRD